MWHKLKTWPPFFEATLRGDKNFELRTNDRDFRIGDYIILEEWDPKTKEYSGRQITKIVSYILEGSFGMPQDKIIMQLRNVP